MCKRSEVVISRNLIGSLPIPTSRDMDNLRCKTMAGVNSHIAVVIEGEVSQMLAFLEFVTEFVYAKTIILFNLGE